MKQSEVLILCFACVLMDDREALARPSSPAVFREKMKERYGELIVDILIRFIGSCESATITCHAVTDCLNINCEMRERNCYRKLGKASRNDGETIAKLYSQSQGFSQEGKLQI